MHMCLRQNGFKLMSVDSLRLNLHRYNISIVERENDIKGMSQVKNFDYEIITCGMPAAHSVGFKNGGL